MRHRLTILMFAPLVVLGATASSASGAANPDEAPCHALFVSTTTPGDLGPNMSDNARTDRPFGQVVVVEVAQTRAPCPE
jgi:hypothetical protein